VARSTNRLDGYERRGGAALGRSRVIPLFRGLALAIAVAMAGQFLAHAIGTMLLGFPRSPLSGITLAVLLGLLLGHALPLNQSIRPGLQFALTRLLRLGIVLLGLRLSLVDIGAIGVKSLAVIVCTIVAALLLVAWLGRRVGVPARIAALIGVGTSICGVTAIIATAPTIGAREDETSYAVACISLFGVGAMLFYPFVAHGLFGGDAMRTGIFLGTAVHDTAQVVGAGMAYQQYFGEASTLEVATVTKMVRNLAMIAVIPLIAVGCRANNTAPAASRPRWQQFVPMFLFGFAAMSLLRTIGDLSDRPFGIIDKRTWIALLDLLRVGADYALTIAMAAVGLSTRLSNLRSIGTRPLALAFVCAVAVGAIGAASIAVLY
jgi:uncharacterized integral membrane protein (TIGR00698 family)